MRYFKINVEQVNLLLKMNKSKNDLKLMRINIS